MANVKITELSPVGSELFQDSESFLDDLREDELGGIQGGSLQTKYELFLEKIRRLEVTSYIKSANTTLQTAITNSVDNNTISRFDFLNENTFVSQTVNGFSISNANTIF